MRSISFVLMFAGAAFGARIKDIATLKGARQNQLVGYGIVVGLAGTGDKSSAMTESSLGLVLKGMGVDIKNQKLDTKNAASVAVSAVLPPYAKMGTKIDVQVASVSTAQSLEGGTLIMSSLRGADGKVYAMANGRVLASKKGGSGGGGGGASGGGNLSTGFIPGGAILERELFQNFAEMKDINYQLITPDFTTAMRMAYKVNEELGGKYATAIDPTTVEVIPPYHYEGSMVELIAQIESIEVEADLKAKVVINAKTGTVVLGEQVRISPVAIAQGNLKIEVKDDRSPSSEGAAAAAAGKDQKLMLMKRGTSIADIASSLNEMGATSEDLITLLQSLRASGALMAEFEMQ